MTRKEFRTEVEKTMPGFEWVCCCPLSMAKFEASTTVKGIGDRRSTFRITLRVDNQGAQQWDVAFFGCGIYAEHATPTYTARTLARALVTMSKDCDEQDYFYTSARITLAKGRRK